MTTDRPHPFWCSCLDCEKTRLEIAQLRDRVSRRDTRQCYLWAFPWWMPFRLARRLPVRLRRVCRVAVARIVIEDDEL